MAKDDIIQCAVVAGLCFVLIAVRTLYKMFCPCKVHSKCYRQWHSDDMWMTFAILPLVGRAVSIAWSAELAVYPPGASAQFKKDAQALRGKLLMSGRIFYLTFLWCCKFCLLALYLRLSNGLPLYRKIGEAIKWSLYITWVGVTLATLLECRPIQIAWNGDPAGATCRKARVNLVTMATCNIITDIALILFPLAIIKRSGLDFYRLVRLSLLFTLGSLVIITTIVRLPLILRDDAQKTRSLWASIEICVACFIAQAPFFQAVYVDRRLGQHSAFTNTSLYAGTNGGMSRSHVSAAHNTRSRSVNRHRGSVGLNGKEQEDEIGLWTIEKRVSFSVSGRTGSSHEFERTESGSDGSEGAGKSDGGIVVSKHVEIVTDERKEGSEVQSGRSTNVVAARGRTSSRTRF